MFDWLLPPIKQLLWLLLEEDLSPNSAQSSQGEADQAQEKTEWMEST